MAEVENQSTGSDSAIIAKPSGDYRFRRYALVLVVFGWGIWSIYDGFYRYPRENAAFEEMHKGQGLVYKPHPGLDIPLNQWLGRVMPPLAVVFLGWVFYNSRGVYRFDGQSLSVPGHPDVQVSEIQKIDRSRWDRKGIAYLHYQQPGSEKLGVVRLDDFIYDRLPTDEIFKRIETHFAGDNTVESVPAA